MICDITGLLAYALHPTYKGIRLSTLQWNEVKTRLYMTGEEVYQQFESFLSGDKGFNDEFLLQTKPQVYWNTMKIQFPLIARIASSYINLPASTASLERVFSMWSYIHNKSRNRLSKKTSENLIFLYHSIKSLSSEKITMLYDN